MVNHKKGFSAIETIIYTGMFSLLFLSITYGATKFINVYRNLKSVRKVENSAMISMDRMIREIRNAESVDSANSSFGVSDGILKLNTIDSNGNNATVRFYKSGNRVYVDENNSQLGPLTLSGTNVSNLMFRFISTTTSDGVKIDLTIESGTSTNFISKNFYNTAVLRGSYE